jgi:hypothetical protein
MPRIRNSHRELGSRIQHIGEVFMQTLGMGYNNPDETRSQLRELLDHDLDEQTRETIAEAITTITQLKSDLRRAGWSFQDRIEKA